MGRHRDDGSLAGGSFPRVLPEGESLCWQRGAPSLYLCRTDIRCRMRHVSAFAMEAILAGTSHAFAGVWWMASVDGILTGAAAGDQEDSGRLCIFFGPRYLDGWAWLYRWPRLRLKT